MGVEIRVDGKVIQAVDISVTEDSTPIGAGDSSGSVGQLSFSLPNPDPHLNPNNPLLMFGPHWLLRKSVVLTDTIKGTWKGRIVTAAFNRATGLINVAADSRLGEANVYNVQAPPFSGTLSNAFKGYLTLAGIPSGDGVVDPSIASRQVTIPGWHGELWYHLKMLATAHQAEIAFVNDLFTLRPLRTNEIITGFDVDRPFSAGGGQLAQAVEVAYYDPEYKVNGLAYPPGGWSEEVTVINVNAGETVEQVLELSASLLTIQQPVMQSFVSRDHDSSSVFTVVGDDGLPVSPAAWSANGGRLNVSINEDTTSLTVEVTAPTGLPNKDGEEIGVYSISLSSDNSTGRYSTLRIIGTGVFYDRQMLRYNTGVGPSETGTDVGVTIDNIFMATINDANRAASFAARTYNGSQLMISQDSVRVNPYDDAGRDVYGNVNGGRVFDPSIKRWFRVRSGTISAVRVSIEAEDDMTYGDLNTSGRTYQQSKDARAALGVTNYREMMMVGL